MESNETLSGSIEQLQLIVSRIDQAYSSHAFSKLYQTVNQAANIITKLQQSLASSQFCCLWTEELPEKVFTKVLSFLPPKVLLSGYLNLILFIYLYQSGYIYACI